MYKLVYRMLIMTSLEDANIPALQIFFFPVCSLQPLLKDATNNLMFPAKRCEISILQLLSKTITYNGLKVLFAFKAKIYILRLILLTI